jgi:succinylglutamate desuccinylase
MNNIKQRLGEIKQVVARKREKGKELAVLHEFVGNITNHQTREVVAGIEGEERPPARAREQFADERCRRRGRHTPLSR